MATTEATDAKKDLLSAYETTYLAVEVVAEQLVRNLNPFRQFLAVAAQMNGKIINFAAIDRDLGLSHNTISSYYKKQTAAETKKRHLTRNTNSGRTDELIFPIFLL